MATPARVLFVHGLESGPNGSKAKYLHGCPGLQVRTPDLGISLFDPRRPNSAVRSLLGQPTAAMLPLAALAVATWEVRLLPGGVPLQFLVGFIGLIFLLLVLLRQALEASMVACTRLVEKEIRDFQPQVLVGSSWGGAVALRCIDHGTWNGSTLLLAPAASVSGNILPLIWPAAPVAISSEAAAFMTVVHGSADDTVPVASSRQLCKTSGARLVEVEGGDHRLNTALLDSGRLRELVLTAAESAPGARG